MELDDGAVNDLVALGLSRYEARVYLTLVRRESYTAAEVARAADVPRQRVYDVLDALVRRRLAIPRPGRVAAFSAVPPELALARPEEALTSRSSTRPWEAGTILAAGLRRVRATRRRSELDLIHQQVADGALVVLVSARPALVEAVPTGGFRQEVRRVDHGDHGVEPGEIAQGGTVVPGCAEVAATGLGSEVALDSMRGWSKRPSRARGHLLGQVIAQGAADAPVGHLDEALVRRPSGRSRPRS